MHCLRQPWKNIVHSCSRISGWPSETTEGIMIGPLNYTQAVALLLFQMLSFTMSRSSLLKLVNFRSPPFIVINQHDIWVVVTWFSSWNVGPLNQQCFWLIRRRALMYCQIVLTRLSVDQMYQTGIGLAAVTGAHVIQGEANRRQNIFSRAPNVVVAVQELHKVFDWQGGQCGPALWPNNITQLAWERR